MASQSIFESSKADTVRKMEKPVGTAGVSIFQPNSKSACIDQWEELRKLESMEEETDERWVRFLSEFDSKTESIKDDELFDYITMIVFDDKADRQPDLLKRYYKKFGSIKKYLSQLELPRWDYRSQKPVFSY